MISISHKDVLDHETAKTLVDYFGEPVQTNLITSVASREWQVIEGDNIVPKDMPAASIELLGTHAVSCIVEKPPEFLLVKPGLRQMPFVSGRELPNIGWRGFQSIFLGTNIFKFTSRKLASELTGDDTDKILFNQCYWQNCTMPFTKKTARPPLHR